MPGQHRFDVHHAVGCSGYFIQRCSRCQELGRRRTINLADLLRGDSSRAGDPDPDLDSDTNLDSDPDRYGDPEADGEADQEADGEADRVFERQAEHQSDRFGLGQRGTDRCADSYRLGNPDRLCFAGS